MIKVIEPDTDKVTKKAVKALMTEIHRDDSKDRNYVNMQVNPCKMCMPMGGAMALKGVKNAMTIIHGSQGCSTYIRRHMAAHYNEPVDIASSSLSEEGTVYGGSKNLKIGIRNLVNMYQPEVVGVLTTCLAETIGDDIERIVREVRETGEFDGIDIIPIPTPGYGGSQTEGYFDTIKALITYFAKNQVQIPGKLEKSEVPFINIILSDATCEDVREIKRMVELFGVKALFIPDISDALDAPFTNHYNKLSEEGISREELKKVIYAKATIELGDLVGANHSPALFLEETFGIKAYRLPLPIGINNTDCLVHALAEVFEKDMPTALEVERGRLMDGMIDAHKHSATGDIAVFGDMNLVMGISCLVLENGMRLKLAATGSMSKRFKEQLESKLDQYQQKAEILQDTDYEIIREVIQREGVNLMIGPSDGKFIWEKDHVDFIRVGFPVHDHVGAQRKNLMGYKGSLRFLDEITNHLLDQKHKGYRDRMYQTYYPKKESHKPIQADEAAR